jgi:hypothetical protein
MKKSLFIVALAIVALGALTFTSCDNNKPKKASDIEKYLGVWHLDSIVSEGVATIRPLDVEVVNDTLLRIKDNPEAEPNNYKWSHEKGKINAPWPWSQPLMNVDYDVVSVNEEKAVLKRVDAETHLYLTHQSAGPAPDPQQFYGTWEYSTKDEIFMAIFEPNGNFELREYTEGDKEKDYSYMAGSLKIEGNLITLQFTEHGWYHGGQKEPVPSFEPYDEQVQFALNGNTLTLTRNYGTADEKQEVYTLVGKK